VKKKKAKSKAIVYKGIVIKSGSIPVRNVSYTKSSSSSSCVDRHSFELSSDTQDEVTKFGITSIIGCEKQISGVGSGCVAAPAIFTARRFN